MALERVDGEGFGFARPKLRLAFASFILDAAGQADLSASHRSMSTGSPSSGRPATRDWDLPSGDARPTFDIMVVAGDLIPRAERGVRWLLESVSDRPVIYVMGNHESYGTDIARARPRPPARMCTCWRTRPSGSAA